ncbi:MAG: GAF domain-containing protein, partial [Pseudomonadota bacterium]
MLNDLRSIVQEVNAARDLQAALDIIVSRVKHVMRVQVCSTYLRDGAGSYVLMATDGLHSESVGMVSLKADEGLVGYVVTREEPINLEQATAHPKYQYFA